MWETDHQLFIFNKKKNSIGWVLQSPMLKFLSFYLTKKQKQCHKMSTPIYDAQTPIILFNKKTMT